VVDLYVMKQDAELDSYQETFFDFMIMDEQTFKALITEIEKKQEESEVAVKGVIAECLYLDIQKQQSDLLKLIYEEKQSMSQSAQDQLQSVLFRTMLNNQDEAQNLKQQI